MGAERSGPTAGAPTLPVGGGAIRSIDQSFTTNSATGTATMTIALPISAGRSGFTPDLALTYDSGNGNGPFGVGWRCELPSIGRKLDQRLPRYDDTDTFVLTGQDDLVPVPGTTERDGSTVQRYRSRTETSFERVERWTASDGAVHWRTIGVDNVTTMFGATEASRIGDGDRVITWLASARWDDRGNALVVDYVADDDTGIAMAAHERHRTPAQRAATRYLATVRYGNRVPNRDQSGAAFDPATIDDWLFSLVFDYGDHDWSELTDGDGRRFVTVPSAARRPGTWPARSDPFSTYRAGFELRTSRLCRRVLMFHHLPDQLGRDDTLVRSLELTYDERPALTRLVAATENGHVLRDGDRYLTASFPTLTLAYTDLPDPAVLQPATVDGDDVCAAVLDPATIWTDLDGDGAAGLLEQSAGALWYRRNSSPAAPTDATFAPRQLLDSAPWRSLHDSGAQLLDIDGDGQAGDLAVLTGPTPTYARRVGRQWEAPGTFDGLPADALTDVELRWLDLDGDGRADIARSDGDTLTWFAAQGTAGFTPGGRVALSSDEDAGLPHLRADRTQAVLTADMTGDGLADLVRVRDGEVCYWPNLGYGRFGAKVTMSAAPHFDDFDPARVITADVDGSGTTDLVYAGASGIIVHLNESGNAWAEPVHVAQLPSGTDPTDVRVTDLLGTGTACVIVLDRRATSVRYLDLMAGTKPHLLAELTNGIGLRTTIEYAPSTTFAAADAAAGEPWLTTLPFPVHVVHRTITADEVTGTVLTARFAYHDGCYDGVERELRGFAMVERFDTELLATLDRLGATNAAAATAVPPTLTRSWFHTGVLADADTLERRSAGGAGSRSSYREPADRIDPAPALAALLPDTIVPDGLTAEEARQAVRALRAAPLREEVYGLDGVSEHPYLVTEHAHRLLCLQHADGSTPAVFHRHLRETVTTAYDRRPTDPRVTHQLTLDVDPDSGQPLVEVAAAYGRRQQIRTVGDDGTVRTTANADLDALDPQDRTAQTTTHLTFTVHRLADTVDEPDDHRAGLAAETSLWELTGFTPQGVRFDADELPNLFAAAAVIDPVDEPDGTTPQRRLVQQQRTLYRRDDLTALAPVGTSGRMALPGVSLRLALTPSVLDGVLARNAALLVPDRAVLTSAAGLVEADGNWWIPSSRTFYDIATVPAVELATARAHFFMPRRTVDPFGQATTVTLEPAELFAGQSVDPLGNTVTATFDYRVLQPVGVVDANGNRSSVIHDALGLVAATALAGKDGQGIGDSLAGVDPDPTPAQRRQAFADPVGSAATLLGAATRRHLYDHDRFARDAGPAATMTLARELHGHQPGGVTSPVRISVTHLDGHARVVQEKARAEAGVAARRDSATTTAAGDVLPGPLLRDANGRPQLADTAERWIGSGRLVLNNKGKPVRRYDPFFGSTALYEPERELTDVGTSVVLLYDPIERVVASLHPEGTYDKVVHTPWRQLTFDVNDTVLADPRTDADLAGVVDGWAATEGLLWETWHERRIAGQRGAAEQQAAQQTEAHADTPAFAHLDPLGRPFATIGTNRTTIGGALVDQPLRTTVVFDAMSNQRAVLDGDGRLVMAYQYDLDGRRLHQSSLDGGELWQLDDALGCTVRTWDGRGVDRRFDYDELRRPTSLFVTEGGAERLAERMEYGESIAGGAADNQRLHMTRSFDAAGIVAYDAYDFTGHAVDTARDLLTDPTVAVDWTTNPATGGGHFRVLRTFDALGRAIETTTPDGSVQRPSYNVAGLLESVTVAVRSGAPTTILAGADYDERGRRRELRSGNGATTTWTFDDVSHALTATRTTRPATADATAGTLFADPVVVQDQRYTYDPSGNVTRLDDAAVATVVNAGQVVTGTRTFTYDAAYRLTAATGREHVAQTALDLGAAPGGWRDRPFVGAHPNDAQAMRNYTQTYEYDVTGNLTTVRHVAANAGWTRTYDYAPSRLQPGQTGNQLARTTVGNTAEDYAYDDGCISRLGALPLTWDHAHRLVGADLGGGGTARYAHDAAGQRVRTVIDAVAGGSRVERIVVDGFELIRTITAGTTTNVREVVHVMAGDERMAIVETVTVDGSTAVPTPTPLVRHQLADHLGSSVSELDGNGALISVEEYHPFGTTSFQAGRSATEVNLRRYRFTGHERDLETGLVQCGLRAYVPWLGRWSSPDPLGVVDGTNGYVYARNNPLVYVDRAGTDVHKVVTTNNHRDVLRDAMGDVFNKTFTDKYVDAQAARIDISKPPPLIDFSDDMRVERAYRSRLAWQGRIVTKLSGFSPPGWEEANGNPAACFRLANKGATLTTKPGESPTKGGGVVLYEKVAQKFKTDKDASDLALAQIKRHVDAGRALIAGISEPDAAGQVADDQPVTDHFVDIYGYETDETGRITALFAKDNAISYTAEVRFEVAADGSITKPAEPKRKDYVKSEYQLSEVRFHEGFEYTGALRPKNDAGQVMFWPNPDPPPPPPPKPKKK